MSKEIVSQEQQQAEVKKILAEAEKFRAETRFAQLQAEELEFHNRETLANARIAENKARKDEEDFKRERAQDKYHNTYRFTSQVTEGSVNAAIGELTKWHRMNPGSSINFVIDSPGGSVIDGMDLFDFILELRGMGHFVTTHTRGYAASMGGILLQAGDKRSAGPNSFVLIHEVALGVVGKIGEIKDEVHLVDLMADRILGIFSDRSREAYENGTSEVALSVDQFKNGDAAIEGALGWNRTDWWMTAQDALRFGVVDEVR